MISDAETRFKKNIRMPYSNIARIHGFPNLAKSCSYCVNPEASRDISNQLADKLYSETGADLFGWDLEARPENWGTWQTTGLAMGAALMLRRAKSANTGEFEMTL